MLLEKFISPGFAGRSPGKPGKERKGRKKREERGKGGREKEEGWIWPMGIALKSPWVYIARSSVFLSVSVVRESREKREKEENRGKREEREGEKKKEA